MGSFRTAVLGRHFLLSEDGEGGTEARTGMWICKVLECEGTFCLVVFLSSSSETRLCRRLVPRLMSDSCMCCHIETEQDNHDFCLSWSFTDTDPTSGVWVPGAGIEPTSS